MSPQQWPLPAELGLDANDPFYSLYTVLYESYQAFLTATTTLENDLHILRRTNSELIAKLENKESQIKLLEKFTKTQRSAEQEREEALEELRKTNLAKKEIQEQLVNFAKRNVILLNEITQKNKEYDQLFVKFENAKDYALEELEELRKEVEETKNLAMEKQDELENLRPNDHTEDDFDNRTLVASTLRSGRYGHSGSRRTSASLSRKTSQDTIRTSTVSVYSVVTSPSNGAQSPVPKDLHPLGRRGSRSVFSLSLNRNDSPTPTVNTPDDNDMAVNVGLWGRITYN
ncbi:hypothetical protein FPQ18DRAFT_304585 [Pyronema domesticum]|nr:hypothetical protein FPQ18DRAFT_304585 [Pyronema domesticum]